MTYNLLIFISTLLILTYNSSIVNSFICHWETGTFHRFGTSINVLNRNYEVQFDPEHTTHKLHCHNAIPRHPRRQARKIGNLYCNMLSQFKKYKSIGVPTQLYVSEGRNDDTSFDFSSKLGWEEYYQRGLNFDNINENDDSRKITTEWHTSIPLETIASHCWNSFNTCDDSDSLIDGIISTKKSILMIGCGTSRLVDVVMAEGPYTSSSINDLHITLLDSSQTCIDELQRRYEGFCNVHCVCGDAVELTHTLSRSRSIHHLHNKEEIPQQFDTIIDKGLMDVLLCSDDWTYLVQKLFTEATKVLIANGGTGGTYILVSYQLPKATREFLLEVACRLGYSWEFNCYGSTKRVTISFAKPRKTDARYEL